MKDITTTEQLAAEFTREVRAHLGEQLDEVNRRNATKEYIGCCATHDYCDANELMLRAYATIVQIPEDDIMLDETMELMNAAWDLAKKSRFELCSTVIARYPNMETWNTGGGCLAHAHRRDDGSYILITAEDDAALPGDDAYVVAVGEYDSEGNVTPDDGSGVEPVELRNLEAHIDRLLKKGQRS
jgi:hypothetical protein